jgi:glycosyltransferase involved in cell wall biosynthesis
MKNYDPKNISLSGGNVSVVIPVRNAGPEFRACLAAVLNQTEAPREVIVVDNGCDAVTRAVMEEFATVHPNLRLVSETMPGRGRARNAGIRAARGGIIAMTDADCTVPSDWLARLVRPITEEGEIVVTGFEESAAAGYWAGMRQEEDMRFVFSKRDGRYVAHLDTKNFAVRAAALKAMLFDPELTAYEDWDLYMRFSAEGVKIRFLPDLLVHHAHDSSFSELVITQFYRGRGLMIAIAKHRHNSLLAATLGSDESALSVRWRNFLLFMPWAIWQFMARFRRAPYLVAADFSWKLGVLIGAVVERLRSARLGIYRLRRNIQLHANELYAVRRALVPPQKLLVFGLGRDSIFWHEANSGGRTVFLEDDPGWLRDMASAWPELEAYRVSYGTEQKDWKVILERPEALDLELPAGVKNEIWDVVLVDGPPGYAGNFPGRMKSIYMAARLVKPGGLVFLHDAERETERAYAERYLRDFAPAGRFRGRALLAEYRKPL